MNDQQWNDDLPTYEPIHTGEQERRENMKNVKARLKKGKCAKKAFSHKQAMTRANQLMAFKNLPYLRAYKCPKCGYWHMTHKKQRV